jgi:hypothetical protein
MNVTSCLKMRAQAYPTRHHAQAANTSLAPTAEPPTREPSGDAVMAAEPAAAHEPAAAQEPPTWAPAEIAEMQVEAAPAQVHTVVQEGWAKPSPDTVASLRECLASTASPRAVSAPLPGSVFTEGSPAHASKTAWLAGEPTPSLPTPRECSAWQRAGLLSAADPATAALAEEAERARPLAYDPIGMMQAAHMKGWDAAAPAKYVAGKARAHAGSFPPANIDALYEHHKRGCAQCLADTECYGAAGLNLLNDFTWPWLASPPAAPLPPPPQPYDPALAPLLKEAIALGVLVPGDPAEVSHFAQAFNAPRRDIAVTDADRARLGATQSGQEVTEVAGMWATSFTERYKSALKNGATPNTAWEEAWATSGVVSKNRFVVDLSYLNNDTRDLPMRYANLQPLLDGCKEGALFGKRDLTKGFHQLLAGRDFLKFAALWVHLEPFGPPTCLLHDRLAMGGKSSPWGFSLYTGFLREAILAALPPNIAIVLIVYLDDFAWRADNEEDWRTLARTIDEVLASVGAQANAAKGTTEPTTEETVLGLELRSRPPAVRLPLASELKTLGLLHVLLRCADDGVPVPRKALASLAGRLNWRAHVARDIPANTRTIARCAGAGHPQWWRFSNAHYSWATETTATAVKAELAWLARNVATSSDRAMRLLAPTPAPRTFASSDASGVTNVVTVVLPEIAFRFHLKDCSGIAVPVMEAMALPLLFAHTGDALHSASLIHGMDCIGAAFWLVNARAKRDEANDIMRLLVRHEEVAATRRTVKWLTRAFNYLSDRGCSARWSELMKGDLKEASLPARLVEVTVDGLPHQFLREWAGRLFPEGFEFSVDAWCHVNLRHAAPPTMAGGARALP